jgi:hypothetical protein
MPKFSILFSSEQLNPSPAKVPVTAMSLSGSVPLSTDSPTIIMTRRSTKLRGQIEYPILLSLLLAVDPRLAKHRCRFANQKIVHRQFSPRIAWFL